MSVLLAIICPCKPTSRTMGRTSKKMPPRATIFLGALIPAGVLIGTFLGISAPHHPRQARPSTNQPRSIAAMVSSLEPGTRALQRDLRSRLADPQVNERPQARNNIPGPANRPGSGPRQDASSRP